MKLGILGSGMIVQDFLSMAQGLNEFDLEAILCTQRSIEKASALAKQYHIKNVFTDYNNLLQSDIDTIYVALPNHLHFQYAKKALEAEKNVIVEKPFTVTFEQALELSTLAKEKQLFLFEAITTLYLPNYKKVKELLPSIGDVKIVSCNFSQYSSRYDRFKNGEILPAFDPNCAGGALMDLNIYNLHFLIGLFGKPKDVKYYPNIANGIDTSGIVMLSYSDFQAVLIGAKDCKAPLMNTIQGEKGCILINSQTSMCTNVRLLMNDNTEAVFTENADAHRMYYEFKSMLDIMQNGDLNQCYAILDHTLSVYEVLNQVSLFSNKLSSQ